MTDDKSGHWAAIDDVLRTRSVVVVIGAGGVGKTTVSAALGVRAADRHGRRTLVVTVDPARRLADALGVDGLAGEAVLVPVGRGAGRLWVLMVEMGQAWDALVRRCAPNQAVVEELLDNELYRSLTTRFVASHDYVALDNLCLSDDHGYDLIIVDTPPGEHSDDIFAAPARLRQFFDSRLLRWLTAGVGGGLGQLAARPFLAVAERLLGGAFLRQISEFFGLFAKLRPRLLSRIDRVERVLASPNSVVVEVWAADGTRPDRRTQERSELVVINRVLPSASFSISPLPQGRKRVDLDPSLDVADLETIDDENLRQAVQALVVGTEAVDLDLPEDMQVAALGRSPGGVNDLDDLLTLFDMTDRP